MEPKNFIINKTKTNNEINCIETTNMQYETNPLKIGNTLNDYFSKIAQKLVNKIKTKNFTSIWTNQMIYHFS